MFDTVRERLERCSSLPTLPSVALQILDLCQQEQLDLKEISAVIGRDPALATKLLRTANSPMFALRREATSIMQAVNLLGVSAVRTMVLSFSLAKECSTTGQPAMASYWQRSMLAALAARELAQRSVMSVSLNPEECFLAALLQDIGMLALARSLGAEYAAMLTEAKGDHDQLIHQERHGLGADHAQVGEWLLRKWRVPILLARVIGASHQPRVLEVDPDKELAALARVVSLAARFADVWMGDCETAAARLHDEVQLWPVDAVDTAAVMSFLVAQAPSLAPMFDVRLNPNEMAEILEQAKEAQVSLSLRVALEVQSTNEALARLESRTAALIAESQRDPLTGVASRGYTDSYLRELFPSVVAASRRIGVIFADVDHFKRVNDTYGHATGDAVLQSVAAELSRTLRGGDFVGRYGGEEFVVIIRADTMQEVTLVAERLRKMVSDRPHAAGPAGKLHLTISLGCALLEPGRHRDYRDLVAEADAALYLAKRNGRNRVESDTPMPLTV